MNYKQYKLRERYKTEGPDKRVNQQTRQSPEHKTEHDTYTYKNTKLSTIQIISVSHQKNRGNSGGPEG